ncbi:hypothetical protein [Chryseobacterium fistulae]|uniref:Uncharacterized protein n=1 Tax=Chryseobacterium fistulae TaxID=2675058 RepID=A0A6N4XUG4_9FLAO|nr:hypothetical protein [Chryseobacterium fistulae]CAA7386930.1 hypothetical protein CHRY9393_01231 [Chryseobacterium fistulae]
MKNNSIFKLLFLVISIFFLNSCRNNDVLTENETYNTSNEFQLPSKTIRLDQSQHKVALSVVLEKIQSSPNTFSKTTGGDVYIDTDNILKLTDATKQAHHIIPWASKIQAHLVVQKAAKSMRSIKWNFICFMEK